MCALRLLRNLQQAVAHNLHIVEVAPLLVDIVAEVHLIAVVIVAVLRIVVLLQAVVVLHLVVALVVVHHTEEAPLTAVAVLLTAVAETHEADSL